MRLFAVRESRCRHLAVLVSTLVVLLSLVGPAAAAPGADGDGSEPVEVVVGFHDRPAPDVVRAFGGTVTDTYDLVPAVAAVVPATAIAALEHHPDVAYVDRDEAARFRDASKAAGDRGGLLASDDSGDEAVSWGVERVGATAVHANGTTGNGVVVAVLDSGVDADHPAIERSYAGGVDFVNDEPVPRDTHGHGTYVAGLVAADGSDAVGVAPGASVYDVKVLNDTLYGDLSDIVAGIEWAVAGRDGEVGTDDDADVIVMSLGSFTGTEALEAAVSAAYEDHGVVVVAAAGNAGEMDRPDTVKYPARYPEAISVGAVNRTGGRPAWSGHGPHLELVAPGVDVRSTYPDGRYVHAEGTSTAAPHVAGAAALVLDSAVPAAADHDADGEWDPAEVRDRLRVTARDLGPEGRDDQSGHGLVDASAAVGPSRPNAPPNVELLAPAAGPVSAVATVRADATDAETMDAQLSVRVAVDGVPVGTAEYDDTTGTFELPIDVETLVDGARGELTVTVTDGEGATASDSVTVVVEDEGEGTAEPGDAVGVGDEGEGTADRDVTESSATGSGASEPGATVADETADGRAQPRVAAAAVPGWASPQTTPVSVRAVRAASSLTPSPRIV